jgi:uncharacterized protein YjbI with pentapeptide repeats
MANPEHVNLIKQGFAQWNVWRRDSWTIRPDLSGLDLSSADLGGADLTAVNLSSVNLMSANLNAVSLSDANLANANLSHASLDEANLIAANLSNVNLGDAFLGKANLTRAELTGANFTKAVLCDTVFADVDLTSALGLEACIHEGPSIIDYRTLQRSSPLPLVFLRGIALPDHFIDYLPSLLNQAVQHYSCFIAYSMKDQELADRLHADLQHKGVRCWFAPHDLTIGRSIVDAIDAAIRLRDRVLLILSEHSINSDWVEDEATAGFEEERKRGSIVLFPIRLDDAVLNTKESWASILRKRFIGDFTRWKDHNAYKLSFERVLRDLTIENPAERYRELTRGLQQRKADEEEFFKKNLTASFTLQAFAWSHISFFENGEYRFSPRVNVLLGRNGYGKTLLFRTLVAVLQRDERYSGLLFPEVDSSRRRRRTESARQEDHPESRNANEREASLEKDDSQADPMTPPSFPKLSAMVSRNFDKLEEIVRDTSIT